MNAEKLTELAGAMRANRVLVLRYVDSDGEATISLAPDAFEDELVAHTLAQARDVVPQEEKPQGCAKCGSMKPGKLLPGLCDKCAVTETISG